MTWEHSKVVKNRCFRASGRVGRSTAVDRRIARFDPATAGRGRALRRREANRMSEGCREEARRFYEPARSHLSRRRCRYHRRHERARACPGRRRRRPTAAPSPRCTVFFVSDGTGITAETFGNSILSQFAIKPRHVRRPFIDTHRQGAPGGARDQPHRRARGQEADRLRHPGQPEILAIVKEQLARPGARHVQHLHRAARGRVRHHLEPPDRPLLRRLRQPGVHRPDRGDQLLARPRRRPVDEEPVARPT